MIKIVTDSSACLKKEEAIGMGVKVVPMQYTVGGQGYLETYTDQNGRFEQLLKSNGKCTTSQPNMAAFLSCFEEEISSGNEVLCITISSRLSGTYSTAYTAAKQSGEDGIAVFDSQMTAGGLYLLLKEARTLIDEGNSLDEVVAKLPLIREKVYITFSVDDMTPLRNSGRIGFVRMSVGTILNIKPVLLCKDGVVVSDGTVRGSGEMIKRLIEKIPHTCRSVVVNYIENHRMATNLYSVIKEKFPQINVKLQKGGPVLGIHLGLFAIAVSYLEQ